MRRRGDLLWNGARPLGGSPERGQCRVRGLHRVCRAPAGRRGRSRSFALARSRPARFAAPGGATRGRRGVGGGDGVHAAPVRGVHRGPVLHRRAQGIGAHLEARELGRRLGLGRVRAQGRGGVVRCRRRRGSGRQRYGFMITLEEARGFVLPAFSALAPRQVAIGAALGCVLAEEVMANEPIPPFANSAMDGYALRAEDTAAAPSRLAVVGSVMAGEHSGVAVGAGEAVRIMTGAPLPPGADAVCMIERTRTQDDATVVVEVAVDAGANVRY